MKVFAVAAALLASVASAADCDVTVLAPLLEETYVAQCSTDTGFTFVPPSVPSADVVSKVCTSDACKQTLAKLESFGLGDCLLLGTLQLETDLINPINAACGFSSASTGSGSTATGSADVGSDVTAPAESSDASSAVETPAASSSSSAVETPAASSSSSAAETDAPATSSEATPTPTPTPDNGAAQQTAAIAAAVVTVAVAAAL